MLMRAAVMALGAIAFVGAGCHSSSHGVAGTGGAGGNGHGDAAGDVTGGGGGATASDGGADARGGSGAGGTMGAGGATDAAGDVYGAGCNTLTPGVAVTLVCAPDGGTPPAPTGGTIVPGTYRLTAITEYGGCTAASLAQTAVITASTIESAEDSTITGLSYLNGTYVATGTDLVETSTCPIGQANSYQFSVNTTAGVTTITLISPGLVAVFTKQ